MLKKPPQKHALKAEMNVVPYIDVMLVLLVIFMVTAPMLVQGVKLELPKVEAEALPTDTKLKILTLSVTEMGEYYWNLGETVDTETKGEVTVDLETMTQKIQQIVADNADTQVFVRGDQAVDYTTVIAAIVALQKGGVTQLSLITEAQNE